MPARHGWEKAATAVGGAGEPARAGAVRASQSGPLTSARTWEQSNWGPVSQLASALRLRPRSNSARGQKISLSDGVSGLPCVLAVGTSCQLTVAKLVGVRPSSGLGDRCPANADS